MRKITTTHTVELTNAEIEILTKALQNEFNNVKERIHKIENSAHTQLENNDSKIITELRENKSEVRELRNFFGDLIGHRYMGADA